MAGVLSAARGALPVARKGVERAGATALPQALCAPAGRRCGSAGRRPSSPLAALPPRAPAAAASGAARAGGTAPGRGLPTYGRRCRRLGGWRRWWRPGPPGRGGADVRKPGLKHRVSGYRGWPGALHRVSGYRGWPGKPAASRPCRANRRVALQMHADRVFVHDTTQLSQLELAIGWEPPGGQPGSDRAKSTSNMRHRPFRRLNRAGMH